MGLGWGMEPVRAQTEPAEPFLGLCTSVLGMMLLERAQSSDSAIAAAPGASQLGAAGRGINMAFWLDRWIWGGPSPCGVAQGCWQSGITGKVMQSSPEQGPESQGRSGGWDNPGWPRCYPAGQPGCVFPELPNIPYMRNDTRRNAGWVNQRALQPGPAWPA